MKHLLTLVALLALAAPAAAAPDAPTVVFAALVPAHTALGVADAKRTVRCVELFDGCYEANPIFNAIAVNRGIRHSMRVKVAADATLTAGFGYALHRWPQRRWVIVGAYATNILIKALVLQHNARVVGRLEP